MVLCYRRRVWSRIVIQQLNDRYGIPDFFFRISSFNFGRVSQYRIVLMVPITKKSSNKPPWVSQKTVRSTLPAKRVVSSFFWTSYDRCLHSIDTAFLPDVKW
ncbi:hypothetical protein TNCV_98501 [Trichonephila clavipes]|nr:hypothetical protein TNCV_98501 [Trichonephila clavipes]